MKNEILLRNRLKVIVPDDNAKANPKIIQALCLEVGQLGYSFSKEVLDKVKTLSPNNLRNFHKNLLDSLSKMIGANVKHNPLFRNFPDDVPDDLEYLTKRIIGFISNTFGFAPTSKQLSCGHFIDTDLFDLSNFGACPICQMQVDESDLDPAKVRPELKEKTKLKVIKLGSDDDIKNIFTSLVGSKSSISASNKADIATIVDLYSIKIPSWIPEEIPFKENLVYITKLLMTSSNPRISYPTYLFQHYKTTTDILRLAVGLSDGDISLATNSKFKNFSRPYRRFIMNMLENSNCSIDDGVKHRSKWIRLGEKLHSGEYANQFSKAYNFFHSLRNEKVKTFNGKVQKALNSRKWAKAVNLLQEKPGEFARKLDYLLRNCRTHKEILSSFKEVIFKVSSNILIQLWGHLKSRNNMKFRAFMPKGKLAKIQVVGETLTPIKIETLNKLILLIKKELMRRFAELPNLGHIFIDEKLKNIPLALSQRSASKSLVTLPRGSKIQLDKDTKYLRMFLYWKQPQNVRTDVDLSATLFDKNWNYKNHLSWTCLSGDMGAHSGDIQSAPNGASEFIDLNLDKYNSGYIVINVYSYTGQPFVQMPEAFAGFMKRNKPKSGEIYEPKTVEHKYDLTAESSTAMPLILDLSTKEMIWADLSANNRNALYGCLERSKNSISKMGMAVTNFVNTKVTLYELAELHALARGKSINQKNKYDTIFGVNEGTYKATDIISINKDLL